MLCPRREPARPGEGEPRRFHRSKGRARRLARNLGRIRRRGHPGPRIRRDFPQDDRLLCHGVANL